MVSSFVCPEFVMDLIEEGDGLGLSTPARSSLVKLSSAMRMVLMNGLKTFWQYIKWKVNVGHYGDDVTIT